MPMTPDGLTVLVVEDAEPLRKMIVAMLLDGGYAIVEAPDGEEALRVIEGERVGIDLVLTDVIMPRMNGTELATRLWQIRPGMPVLFMSGYSENPLTEGVRNGACFLRKPFTSQGLIERVRHAIAGTANHAARNGNGVVSGAD